MNQGQLWHEKHDHQWKTNIRQWQENNILIKMALSKSASYANLQVEVWKSQNKKKENAYAHQIQTNLDSPSNRKTKLRRNTNLENNY